jgi:hypothetical protein
MRCCVFYRSFYASNNVCADQLVHQRDYRLTLSTLHTIMPYCVWLLQIVGAASSNDIQACHCPVDGESLFPALMPRQSTRHRDNHSAGNSTQQCCATTPSSAPASTAASTPGQSALRCCCICAVPPYASMLLRRQCDCSAVHDSVSAALRARHCLFNLKHTVMLGLHNCTILRDSCHQRSLIANTMQCVTLVQVTVGHLHHCVGAHQCMAA